MNLLPHGLKAAQQMNTKKIRVSLLIRVKYFLLKYFLRRPACFLLPSSLF